MVLERNNMICVKCKAKNEDDAKYCNNCGQELKTEAKERGAVDTYFAKQSRGCQICGSLAPTRKVAFYQNIGMLLYRENAIVKGRLCKKCINREFKKKTLTTLFFGWWGAISFWITPFYLLNNVFRFIPTIGMKLEEY